MKDKVYKTVIKPTMTYINIWSGVGRPERKTRTAYRQGCPIEIPKNPEISGSSRKSSLGAEPKRLPRVESGGGGGSSRTEYEQIFVQRIMGKTRKDHVRNQVIQEDANVYQMTTFLRQKMLKWYGHIRRREEDNLSRKNDGHGCTVEEKKKKTKNFYLAK